MKYLGECLNVYKVIQSMGKSIPGDYSVIGFDNVSKGRLSYPTLSTFNVPREQIGDEIGLYIARLRQEDRPQYSEFTIRCDFIERDSVRKLDE